MTVCQALCMQILPRQAPFADAELCLKGAEGAPEAVIGLHDGAALDAVRTCLGCIPGVLAHQVRDRQRRCKQTHG